MEFVLEMSRLIVDDHSSDIHRLFHPCTVALADGITFGFPCGRVWTTLPLK